MVVVVSTALPRLCSKFLPGALDGSLSEPTSAPRFPEARADSLGVEMSRGWLCSSSSGNLGPSLSFKNRVAGLLYAERFYIDDRI